MKISLFGFSDLGKCSFGTLLDDYDTNDHRIYLDHKEIEIKKVEDLFPFLWQHAGISTKDGNITKSYFWEEGTWWHQLYDGSIWKYDKKILYYMKKLKKETNLRKKEDIALDIKTLINNLNGLSSFLLSNDNRMEEIKQKLIEANNGI
jgi:hypothetical protein